MYGNEPQLDFDIFSDMNFSPHDVDFGTVLEKFIGETTDVDFQVRHLFDLMLGDESASNIWNLTVEYDEEAERIADALAGHFVVSHDPASIATWALEQYGNDLSDRTLRAAASIIFHAPNYTEQYENVTDVNSVDEHAILETLHEFGLYLQTTETVDVTFPASWRALQIMEPLDYFEDVGQVSVPCGDGGTLTFIPVRYGMRIGCEVQLTFESDARNEIPRIADMPMTPDVHDVWFSGGGPHIKVNVTFEWVTSQRDIAIDVCKKALGMSKREAASNVDRFAFEGVALETVCNVALQRVSFRTTEWLLKELFGVQVSVNDGSLLLHDRDKQIVVFADGNYSQYRFGGGKNQPSGIPQRGGVNPLLTAKRVAKLVT